MPTYNHPLFGLVTFEIVNSQTGAIRIDGIDVDLEEVVVPQLRGKPLYTRNGDSFSGKLRWHKRGKDQLLQAWAEVEHQGLLGRVLTFDGAYNSRLIRGSSRTPSNHAFGTAFDINASWNPYRSTPRSAGQIGSVRELVPIFERFGFKWGGDFITRPDGMHFEISRFLTGAVDETPDSMIGIRVYREALAVDVPAFLSDEEENDHTLIGIRAFTSIFGGALSNLVIDSSSGELSVTLHNADRDVALRGQLLGNVGYVKFTDMLPAYPGMGYTFDGKTDSLVITPKGGGNNSTVVSTSVGHIPALVDDHPETFMPAVAAAAAVANVGVWDFAAAIKQVLKWEGNEFTDDPDDKGGATRYGITQSRYDEYRKFVQKATRSVEDIDFPSEVEAIYRKYYWNVIKGDQLPQVINIAVMDAAVNHGPSRAAKWLQELVHVAEDGNIGNITLNAVRIATSDAGLLSERGLASKYCDKREAYYKDIGVGTQQKFLKGWMNRLNDLRRLLELTDGDGAA